MIHRGGVGCHLPIALFNSWVSLLTCTGTEKRRQKTKRQEQSWPSALGRAGKGTLNDFLSFIFPQQLSRVCPWRRLKCFNTGVLSAGNFEVSRTLFLKAVWHLKQGLHCKPIDKARFASSRYVLKLESVSTWVWCVPGFGAGSHIALKPRNCRNQQKSENVEKGTSWFSAPNPGMHQQNPGWKEIWWSGETLRGPSSWCCNQQNHSPTADLIKLTRSFSFPLSHWGPWAASRTSVKTKKKKHKPIGNSRSQELMKQFSLRLCRSSSVIFFCIFCREILREIWWEFYVPP